MTELAKTNRVEVTLERNPKPEMKQIGGSDYDAFNQVLADQTMNALWLGHSDDPARQKQALAAAAALIGGKPRDEIEGMLIGQMVACHSAAMECHRRAMLDNQTVDGRQVNLGAASKLSRTYAALLEALNRHRGKGQQVVRVEHVTVQAGGQAIVGAVTQGVGGDVENADRAHAQAALVHAPEPTLRCQDPAGEPVPVAGGAGAEALPDARRSPRQRRQDG
ncbi:MAG: hypothetical protein U1E17_24840 [Geminicoccaceae bacterium]